MIERSNEELWTAAEKANQQFGQWMPQRWVELFIVALNERPSDPSSTRSEVTALAKRLDQVLKVMRGARNRSEPMAVWSDDIKAVEDARALLDQFEIRRKS